MITIKSLLQEASAKLHDVFEAELLLAFILQKPRSFLHSSPDTLIAHEIERQFTAVVRRRIDKEPIAYITGKRDFWTLDLQVTRDTLIPRPETELLVEWVLETVTPLKKRIKLADLGTGSGAIALALASESALFDCYATDQDPKALAVAAQNAARHKINNVTFLCGDWCKALPAQDFDIIVSNPPYISEVEWQDYQAELQFEPKAALLAADEGLAHLKTIIEHAKAYLGKNGYVFVEHGFLQGPPVRELFAIAGYQSISTKRDLSQHERITRARFTPL